MKTYSTKYTKTHDLKRNAKRKEFKFYLDDVEEAMVYKAISDAQNDYDGGAKGFIIDAVKSYLKKEIE